MTTQETTTKTRFVPQGYETHTEQSIDDREDWIPVEEAELTPPPQNADIFDIRMNNQAFLYELWRGLAGMTYAKKDGRHYLRPMKHTKPLLKKDVAMEIINYLRMLNQPGVVLGNITAQEFIVERDKVLRGLQEILIDKKRLGITGAQRGAIWSFLIPVISHQLSRAVKGFEANNLITNIAEERGDHRVFQSEGKKGAAFSWNKSSGGDR